MGFGLDPSQARLATRTLFVLSAVLGSTVLISNYRTWRAKGGSTTSPGGVSRGQDLRSSLSQITSVLAASTILSGLLGFAGT